jgi:hypothetical protein
MENALGVLSGKEQLRIGLEKLDILLLSSGVFVAMLLALILSKHL